MEILIECRSLYVVCFKTNWSYSRKERTKWYKASMHKGERVNNTTKQNSSNVAFIIYWERIFLVYNNNQYIHTILLLLFGFYLYFHIGIFCDVLPLLYLTVFFLLFYKYIKLFLTNTLINETTHNMWNDNNSMIV